MTDLFSAQETSKKSLGDRRRPLRHEPFFSARALGPTVCRRAGLAARLRTEQLVVVVKMGIGERDHHIFSGNPSSSCSPLALEIRALAATLLLPASRPRPTMLAVRHWRPSPAKVLWGKRRWDDETNHCRRRRICLRDAPFANSQP